MNMDGGIQLELLIQPPMSTFRANTCFHQNKNAAT